MSGNESDTNHSFDLSQLSDHDSSRLSGYEGDDEYYNYEEIMKELPKLVRQGTIFGEIEGSPDDEVPKGKILEDESTLTQDEETQIENAVKTEIGELEITIEEKPEQQLPTISEEPIIRKSERLKTPVVRYSPEVIIKVKPRNKKPVTQPP